MSLGSSLILVNTVNLRMHVRLFEVIHCVGGNRPLIKLSYKHPSGTTLTFNL